jgi:hypothetical protein
MDILPFVARLLLALSYEGEVRYACLGLFLTRDPGDSTNKMKKPASPFRQILCKPLLEEVKPLYNAAIFQSHK